MAKYATEADLAEVSPSYASESDLIDNQTTPIEQPKYANESETKLTGIEQLLRVSAKDRVSALLSGGITSMAGGAKDSEDVLPAVNGALGGILGSYVGRPNMGVGFGTAIGEFEKQGIEKLSGERKDINVSDIIIKGGAAAATSKLFEWGLKSAGVAKNIVPEETRAKFFEKALQAVEVGKDKLGSNFGKAVSALAQKYPNSRVDLRDPLIKIKEVLGEFGEENLVPQLRTAVRNSPKLKAVVEEPSKAFNLTLQEAIDLKNAITSTTNAITKRAMVGKTTPNERVVFEILDSIDNQITKPFQEMRDIRKVYAAGKQAYDLARPLVERGKAVENTIFSKPQGLFGISGSQFGGSTQGKLALKEIMSMTKPGGKMFEAAELAHNLNRVADTVGRLGEIAVGGAAVKKLLGQED